MRVDADEQVQGHIARVNTVADRLFKAFIENKPSDVNFFTEQFFIVLLCLVKKRSEVELALVPPPKKYVLKLQEQIVKLKEQNVQLKEQVIKLPEQVVELKEALAAEQGLTELLKTSQLEMQSELNLLRPAVQHVQQTLHQATHQALQPLQAERALTDILKASVL